MAKRTLVILLATSFAVLHGGCSSYRIVTRRSELGGHAKTGNIRVLTREGSLYELFEYQLTESQLRGRGYMIEGKERNIFTGALDLSEIDYIMVSKTDPGKTAAGLITAAVFGRAALTCITSAGKLKAAAKEKRVQHSCPFIYTSDGSQYRFESETFASAIFRGAERSAYDVLEYLKPVGGEYLLKLSCERPETDYVNEIRLQVIDAPEEVKVIPSADGNLHTIAGSIPPGRCSDIEGTDVLSEILARDNISWRSDIQSKDLTEDKHLRDGLVLQFEKPEGVRQAKLVVRAGNTALGPFAIELLCSLRGVGLLQWYQKLDNDPAERLKVAGFMAREGMLKVMLMQNGQWIAGGCLPDVGPWIQKDQIAVLDLSECRGETLCVKLESTTDLWRIDQVYIDYSLNLPLEVQDANLRRAVSDNGVDATSLLRSEDDFYHATIQGQSVDMAFEEIPERPNRSRWYVLKSTGYYHPWVDLSCQPQPELADRILTESLFGAREYLPVWRSIKNE